MTKRRQFDDNYNELFAQPTKKSIFHNTLGEPHHKNNTKRIRTSWLIIGLLAIIVIFMGRIYFAAIFSSSSSNNEVYPLKIANVKATGPKDVNKPLTLKLDNKTFQFNRNYQLKVVGHSEIKLDSKELSVLTTDDTYAYDKSAADITFETNGDYYYKSSFLAISGNLVNSTSAFVQAKSDSFVQAYPLKPIDGTVNQGYIVEYDQDKDSISTRIKKYYMFSDGTGFIITLNSDSSKKLDKKQNLKTIQKIYKKDFDFIENHYQFKKIS